MTITKARLSNYYQAIQVYLQQTLVYARDLREETNQKIKRRLASSVISSERTLEKDLEIIDQMEKTCKKLQMRSITLCSAVGFAELALLDRLGQAIKWSVLTARHEGRVNYDQYLNRAGLFRHSCDLLARCVEACVMNNTVLAELWATAEQLCVRVGTGSPNLLGSDFRYAGLPKPPTDLPDAVKRASATDLSEDLRRCWKEIVSWRQMEWAHDTIAFLMEKFTKALPEAISPKGVWYTARARVCGDVADEFHRAAEVLEKLRSSAEGDSVSSAEDNVAALRKRAAELSLAHCEHLAHKYHSGEVRLSMKELHAMISLTPNPSEGGTIAVLIGIANKLEERQQWRERMLAILPTVVEHKTALETMLDVCTARCNAIAERFVGQMLTVPEDMAKRFVADLFTKMPLPKPEFFQHAELCAEKRHKLRLSWTEDDPCLALAESAWIAATAAYGRYFSLVVEILSEEGEVPAKRGELSEMELEYGEYDRYSERRDLPAEAERELLQARNYAHCAGGMCQDAVLYRRRAMRIRQKQRLQSQPMQLDGQDQPPAAEVEEAVAWENASLKMLAAAQECFDSIADLEPDPDEPVLRECVRARDLEQTAVHQSQLAELLQRCSLAPSTEEQAALERYALLSRKRLMLDEALETVKKEKAGWRNHLQDCRNFLQSVIITAQRAASPLYLRGAVPQTDRAKVLQLEWLVPELGQFCDILVRAAAAPLADTTRWSAFSVVSAITGLLGKVENWQHGSESTPAAQPVPLLPTLQGWQRRIKLMLAGMEAHLQGHWKRGALLLEAARYTEKGKGGAFTTEQCLLGVAEGLLHQALSTDEIQSQIGNLQVRVHEPCAEFVAQMVQTFSARTDADIAHHTVSASAATNPSLDGHTCSALYELAVAAYDQQVHHLQQSIEQRVQIYAKDSKKVADQVRQAHWAQETAGWYARAAYALQHGQLEASRYWRRAAAYSSQRHLKAQHYEHELNDALEIAAHRCARAAKALLASANHPDTPLDEYWRGAADAIIADLTRRSSFATADQVRDYFVADCAHEISTAQAQNRPLVADLWQSLNTAMATLRSREDYASVAEGTRKSTARKAVEKARQQADALKARIAALEQD